MNAIEAGAGTGGLGRPFAFMIPFWGQRYRDYFVDLALPSVLAPNNLSLLRAEDGHSFLMATTAADRRAIEHLPIMERLRAHATPQWIEIDAPADGSYFTTIRHLGRCLRILVEAAFERRPYGCMLLPDILVSDGMVASLLRAARAGHHLVLLPTLRQMEEPVLADLAALGLLRKGTRPSITADALIVPQRVMADLLVRHLHPEIAVYEEGSPFQPARPPFRIRRIPGHRGIVFHTFFAMPLLMDYSVVAADHTACLDHDAYENVYIGRNFSHCGGLYVVQDSDEFAIASITPSLVNQSLGASERRGRREGWLARYARLCDIRESMWSWAGRYGDAVRCQMFRLPIRWHADDLDDAWTGVEREMQRDIDRAVGDYVLVGEPPHGSRLPSRPSFTLRYFPIDLALGRFAWKRLAAKARSAIRRRFARP